MKLFGNLADNDARTLRLILRNTPCGDQLTAAISSEVSSFNQVASDTIDWLERHNEPLAGFFDALVVQAPQHHRVIEIAASVYEITVRAAPEPVQASGEIDEWLSDCRQAQDSHPVHPWLRSLRSSLTVAYILQPTRALGLQALGQAMASIGSEHRPVYPWLALRGHTTPTPRGGHLECSVEMYSGGRQFWRASPQLRFYSLCNLIDDLRPDLGPPGHLIDAQFAAVWLTECIVHATRIATATDNLDRWVQMAFEYAGLSGRCLVDTSRPPMYRNYSPACQDNGFKATLSFRAGNDMLTPDRLLALLDAPLDGLFANFGLFGLDRGISREGMKHAIETKLSQLRGA
jgi:hypothetical protein